MDDVSGHSPQRWRLLRWADQTAVAALVLLGLAATALWWVRHGGWRGGLIEVEQVEPLSAEFHIDINSADWPEIMQLPYIGETLARRIVEYRQQHGPFKTLEDLCRVRGIGPKTLERIRPYLWPAPAEIADRPQSAPP